MRAKNMQALTDDIKREHPGVVIYGVGDDAHKTRISDHNEDDTPGVRAAQSDADNIPEHRAIDVMLGQHFSKADADELVANLLADESAKKRLIYIIFNGRIWMKDNDWHKAAQEGDQHTDHVHLSGDVDDDNNSAGWPAVSGKPLSTTSGHVVKRGASGEEVRKIQRFFQATFPAYRHDVSVRNGVPMVVDGYFGSQTEAWVKEFQSRTDLFVDGIVGPRTFDKMRSFGYR